MILDKMENLTRYESAIPGAATLAALWAEGRVTEAPYRVIPNDFMTKDDADRRWEVHFHTIDLMICTEGSQRINLCDAAELTPGDLFPEGKDGQRLLGAPRGTSVLLTPGCFIAIYPGEAHMVAGHPAGESVNLKKLVVKIPTE